MFEARPVYDVFVKDRFETVRRQPHRRRVARGDGRARFRRRFRVDGPQVVGA